MTGVAEMVADLRHHLALHTELLGWIEKESMALKQTEGSSPFEVYQARKEALPRLDDSLSRLRRHRDAWLKMTAEERGANPEVRQLLRQNQDLVLRLIVLDRENEQWLLRRGLVPARHLPPVNRQRPHYVADLYRKQSGGSAPS